jgi:MFS transporter, ACS family, solute carrier family 17 (sodium-dependent inorganic phosphate cotransporter), other
MAVAVDESPLAASETNDNLPLFATLGLLWIVAAVSALDRVAMSVAVVSMSSEFGFTETMKGSISSLFSVGYGLGILPAGIILSYLSPRYVLAFGLTLWSVATILTPSSADLLAYDIVIPILIIRAFVGIGESMVVPTFHRLLAVWTNSEQKSSGKTSLTRERCCDTLACFLSYVQFVPVALAFVFSGFHAGTICAYLLSPIIMDSLGGWRSLFFTYGWLGLLLLGPWLLLAKDAPASQTSLATSVPTYSGAPQVLPVEGPLENFRNAPWKDFASSKGAWGMLLAHSARNWGLYTMLAWLPTFYSEQYDMGVRDSAWLSVMPSVAGAAGGFLAGALADNILRSMRNKTDASVTTVRKVFQSIGLLGPAAVLASMALNIPEEAWVAQLFFMAAVGLQSFNAGGFEAANQDLAGPKWTGMLYSVTSLPAVMRKLSYMHIPTPSAMRINALSSVPQWERSGCMRLASSWIKSRMTSVSYT